MYKEIGRCSRDGRPGIAVLLYEPGDLKRQEFLIEKTLPNSQQIKYFIKHQELLQNFPSEETQLLARLLANGYQKDQIEILVKKRQTERNDALKKCTNILKLVAVNVNLSHNILVIELKTSIAQTLVVELINHFH